MSTAKWQNIAGSKKFFSIPANIFSQKKEIDLTKIISKQDPL